MVRNNKDYYSIIIHFPAPIRMCTIGTALPVVEHGWVVGVEEEVLDAVHGDDQPRDEGAAQLQVADEPLLGDPSQGAAQEDVVEPV